MPWCICCSLFGLRVILDYAFVSMNDLGVRPLLYFRNHHGHGQDEICNAQGYQHDCPINTGADLGAAAISTISVCNAAALIQKIKRVQLS